MTYLRKKTGQLKLKSAFHMHTKETRLIDTTHFIPHNKDEIRKVPLFHIIKFFAQEQIPQYTFHYELEAATTHEFTSSSYSNH